MEYTKLKENDEMTTTERNTIRELEAKGYEQVLHTATKNMHDCFKLNIEEAKAIAADLRTQGHKARIVGPNPYHFPFRVYVKKAEVVHA